MLIFKQPHPLPSRGHCEPGFLATTDISEVKQPNLITPVLSVVRPLPACTLYNQSGFSNYWQEWLMSKALLKILFFLELDTSFHTISDYLLISFQLYLWTMCNELPPIDFYWSSTHIELMHWSMDASPHTFYLLSFEEFELMWTVHDQFSQKKTHACVLIPSVAVKGDWWSVEGKKKWNIPMKELQRDGLLPENPMTLLIYVISQCVFLECMACV